MQRAPRLPPPLVMALCGVLAWALPATGRLPATRAGQAAGIALMALGLALNVLPKHTFRRQGTTVNPLHPERSERLVRTGLHAYSRNPMYAGQALLLLGWAVWLAQPWALTGVAIYLLWIDRLQIPAEERALRARFGAEYDAYCRRVRRWL